MSGRRPLCAVALSVLLVGCHTQPEMESLLADVAAETAQALVVQPTGGAVHRGTLAAFERHEGGWRCVFGPVAATVGRSGIVAGADKREGDGGTPAGTHRLGTAFGYAASLPTRLGYRQATADDWWIDDPASPAYNTWVTGKPPVSAERMRRDNDQYSQGAVIEWNTARREPGRGSAIFLHVWAGPDAPTEGCVAVAAADLRALLAWLDAALRPVVTIDASGR